MSANFEKWLLLFLFFNVSIYERQLSKLSLYMSANFLIFENFKKEFKTSKYHIT